MRPTANALSENKLHRLLSLLEPDLAPRGMIGAARDAGGPKESEHALAYSGSTTGTSSSGVGVFSLVR